MTALRNLIFSLGVLVVLQFIFSTLAPERYRTAIKMALSLITVAVVSAGILKIDFSDIYSSFPSINTELSSYESDQLILDELNSKLSEYIASQLEDEGVVSEKVSVDTTIDENRCISITKASIELGSEYEKDEAIIISLIKSKIGDIEVSISFVEV